MAARITMRTPATVTAMLPATLPATLPTLVRALRFGVCAALCMSTLSCGGGGGSSLAPGSTTPSGSNVVSVVVDSGPANNTVNTLYTTVTVCVPGSTTNCQTIDHIQVDTQSVGLRIMSSVLTLTLPGQMAGANSLAECTVFADGFTWGPIALADVQISGESASSVPIQVLGDSGFTAVPSDCSGQGTEEDTVTTFGANGILGIGFFAQDCGSACASVAEPASYYSCTTAACQATTVPLNDQVQNPVSLFAADNNGTIIQLPSVAADGALTITGSLIFGIDTQSNNASGSETVLTVAGSAGSGAIMPGNLTVVYNQQSLEQSFIDSGSNGLYFDDSSIPQCTESGLSGFYCPTSTLNTSAMLQGVNAVSASVDFSVENAETLGTNNPTFVVLPTLAGTSPLTDSFDFGLAFYYGRRVATAMESQTTTVGTGPYVAF
jgi:hypothetical protein